MSAFQDALAGDVEIFFDEFSEPATYSGIPIQVIPEIGSNWQKGGPVASDGVAGTAFFSVRESDVADPQGGDVIAYKSKNYTVLRVIETDGLIHKVECTFAESSIYRR